MKVFYDRDADLSILRPHKIAILGFGSQGHAHALNLRDSGMDVRVGLRKDSPSWEKAEKQGLRVLETAAAAREADIIMVLVPDEMASDIFKAEIEPLLTKGKYLALGHGFQTLVEAGYAPEMAYFECLHEVKLIVDLIYEGGIRDMRYSISNTAEYGDMTRGKRVVGEATRNAMKQILADIQSGKFAAEWIGEYHA